MCNILDNFLGLLIFRADIVSIKVWNEEVHITSAKRTAHFLLLLAVPELNNAVATKDVSAIRLDFLLNVAVTDSAVLGVYLGGYAHFLECGVGDEQVSRKHLGDCLDEDLDDRVFPGDDE